ncbi:hypothetical protein [Variovorax sp. Root434]|uniref:hypothetical protein n=1 Tax=Variovorax sp. Root434 TaxID=1736536 RepID=UPI000B1139A1|nr:hypothetical protein [Variovorax sp. Root434]
MIATNLGDIEDGPEIHPMPTLKNLEYQELFPWGRNAAAPILGALMSVTQQQLQLLVKLPDGWSSRIDIQRTTDGRYAGVAELSLRGLKRGVLVFMQQPTLEAAVERVRLRASQFARARLSLPSARS